MKYRHRVMGMLSLLAVITYVDRVCIAGQLFDEPVAAVPALAIAPEPVV